jgi:TIR domain
VPEVFISYSQKDRELVAPIAARLAELGVEAWFDQEISAGEAFGAVIRARLREAKAVLVCWSPEAIQSTWVDAEADYARENGTYVPSFVAPCALMPPFNRIHTDDLSNWNHSTGDAMWLKLVDRISKLLGRDGVAAAARAYASGDEKALYAFAQRFPEEPAAVRIWRDAEMRHRAEFSARLDEARTAMAHRGARIAAEAADLEARIEAIVPAFEAWLANEKRGSADTSKLDPLALVKHYISPGERKLREEVAGLSSALAHAKGVEEELEAAKTEITRFNEELTGRNEELDRFQKESASSYTAAKTEIARLTEELSDGRREQDRLQSNLAAADSQVIELKDQLNNANLLVDGLSKLKGADEIMGAEAAQAHSAVQQPKAPATSMKNPSDSSAKDPKKQLWAVGFTFASLASLFLLIVLAGSNTGASGFFVFLVFAVLVVAAGYTFKRATSA